MPRKAKDFLPLYCQVLHEFSPSQSAPVSVDSAVKFSSEGTFFPSLEVKELRLKRFTDETIPRHGRPQSPLGQRPAHTTQVGFSVPSELGKAQE